MCKEKRSLSQKRNRNVIIVDNICSDLFRLFAVLIVVLEFVFVLVFPVAALLTVASSYNNRK